mgnify:CR=1 FL=1
MEFINIKDELPKKSGPYWTFNGLDKKPSVIQQRVHMYNHEHKEFNCCTVTHWMELPKNPEKGPNNEY